MKVRTYLALMIGAILLGQLVNISQPTSADAREIRYKKGVYNGTVTRGKENKLLPHGQGVYVWNSGNYARYKGGFSFGKIGGLGQLTYRNGTVCHGRYNSKIKINSFADCKYASGARYKGTMERGKRHHEGTYQYSDGAVYRGTWKYGVKHGRGEMKYANGKVYVGPWRNGKRHSGGEGRLDFRKNGKLASQYIGYFKNNKMHGKGEFNVIKNHTRYCVVVDNGKIISKRKNKGPRANCY